MTTNNKNNDNADDTDVSETQELIEIEAESEERDQEMISDEIRAIGSEKKKDFSDIDSEDMIYILHDLNNTEQLAMQDMIDEGACSVDAYLKYSEGVYSTNCSYLATIHTDSGKSVVKQKETLNK